jgi:hypothetical protein
LAQRSILGLGVLAGAAVVGVVVVVGVVFVVPINLNSVMLS